MEFFEQCGRWPQQACTTMFFMIPKNVTSDRPAALIYVYDASLVGSLALRGRRRWRNGNKNFEQGWRKLLSELVSQRCGLGRLISISPQRSCVFFAAISNTNGTYSSKDVWELLQTMRAILSRRKDYTTLVGLTKGSVKDVSQMKARRSTDSITARVEVSQKPSPRGLAQMEAKGRNFKDRLEVAQRNHVVPSG